MKLSVVRMYASMIIPGRFTALLALSGAISIASHVIADTDNDSYVTGKNELSLKLRNYYQDRGPTDPSNTYIDESGKKVNSHKKQQAWGQGLEINFASAYLGNETAGIGMDFSLYGGLKLIGDKDRFGTTIAKEDTPYYDSASQRYLAEQNNYAKVGQAYAKAFVGNEGLKASAKIGWHQINRTLMKPCHRLTPTAFQGASADAELGNVDLYSSWYNKVSRHNNDKFENPTSPKSEADGANSKYEKINYAYTLGGTYNHASGLGSELAYAESESYLKLYHANLNYTYNLNANTALLVEGQYFKGEGNGNKWRDNTKTYGGFDNSANLYNLNAKLSLDMLSFKASYSQVDAEKKNGNGLGVFDYHLAYDSGRSYDNIGYWTNRQISDFNHNGEKVWQAGVSYAFDQIGAPGLMLGYTYTQGNDIKTNNMDYTDQYKESEHNIEVGYDFQQERLKGLSLKLQYAKYKADKELSEIKNSNKEGYSDNGMTDLRVYIDYTLSVF